MGLQITLLQGWQITQNEKKNTCIYYKQKKDFNSFKLKAMLS